MASHKRSAGSLEHLFGSRTRAKLLRMFLLHPDVSYYTREAARRVSEQLNSVRRELANLEQLELLKSEERANRRFFQIAKEHYLVPELSALFLKAQVLFDHNLLARLTRLGRIRFLVLTGQFVGLGEQTLTDILVVGSCNRGKLRRLLRELQRNFDKPLSYTVMTFNEFSYRNGLTDRFLYSILENRKIVLIDKLPVPKARVAPVSTR
jgi:DNA-binding transcriptional ArsR family regulator